MKALVSVCIPTYNHSSVIGEALRSAMAQDYENLEILVVDNHSEDDTERRVAEIAAGDSRVRYVRHPENVGMARNFSACVSLAVGKYIKLLCADDLLEPHCVSCMVGAMEDHPRVELVACSRQLVNRNLEPIKRLAYSSKFELVEGGDAVRRCFFRNNLIGEPTAVMFRRSSAARGFDGSYHQAVDLEMWFHLLARGRLAFIPDALCSVRIHDDRATLANIASGRIVDDKRRLFRQIAGEFSADARFFEKLLWDLRMASSVARARIAGAARPGEITEVYFGAAFRWLLLPLAERCWRSGVFHD